jgi:putative ABC transport system ATP-binding protein
VNNNEENKKILLKIEGLSKLYHIGNQEISACKNLNFNINEGEFCVILGPSGSGKTTLLNLIGGMDTTDVGSILFKKDNILKYSTNQLTLYRRNEIGFVFQFYNLMPNLTVIENVELACEVKKTDSLVPAEVLEKVGLSHRLNNFPSQISGGEQQRCAMARAIAKNPSLLLCDEPTGALDFQSGIDVLELLSNFCRIEKKTVVVVTHNQSIKEIADHVITLQNGTVLRDEYNSSPKKVSDLVW